MVERQEKERENLESRQLILLNLMGLVIIEYKDIFHMNGIYMTKLFFALL